MQITVVHKIFYNFFLNLKVRTMWCYTFICVFHLKCTICSVNKGSKGEATKKIISQEKHWLIDNIWYWPRVLDLYKSKLWPWFFEAHAHCLFFTKFTSIDNVLSLCHTKQVTYPIFLISENSNWKNGSW